MSSNISTEEDFPALPIATKKVETSKRTGKRVARTTQRSHSALSSESVGEFEENKCPKCTRKIGEGSYVVARDAFLRPYLNCRCVYCWDLKSRSITNYVREDEWNGCEKKRSLKKGLFCKVLKSKVVNHRADMQHIKEKYSVAYVETGEGRRGWVPSRFLVSHVAIRSESVLRKVQWMEEMDRSRTNSVCSFDTSAPQTLFKHGELVRVRIETGAWKDAEVRNVNPYFCEGKEHILILLHDETQVCYFPLTDVQKYPAREFVALKDVPIRANEAIDRWSVGTLKKGSSVSVAYWRGNEARITAPMHGWITMRTKHNLNVLERDYTFLECNPSVVVNVPGHMTEMDLVAVFQQAACVTPERITFQANNGKFRAIVEITGYKTGKNIVDLGGASFTNGESFSFSWYLPYLKSRAYNTMMTTKI